MKSSVCPMCKGPRAPAANNPAYPFCCPRCKLADLSNWFNESYAVPDQPVSPDEEPNPDAPPTVH